MRAFFEHGTSAVTVTAGRVNEKKKEFAVRPIVSYCREDVCELIMFGANRP